MVLDPSDGIGLYVEVSVGLGLDGVAFFFTAGIDAHDDGLGFPAGRLDVQADAEDSPIPEGCRFPGLDHLSCALLRARHEGFLIFGDDRYHDENARKGLVCTSLRH